MAPGRRRRLSVAKGDRGAGPGAVSSPCLYDYRAQLVRVVDGDTLWVMLDLGVHVHRELDVRLLGVNCPELPTPEGKAAAEFARTWLAGHADLKGWLGVRTHKDRTERYGRYLATIYQLTDPATTLNDDLVDAGHATAATR